MLEKGSEIGAHILSGAVLEPRALAELFPDWKELGAPLEHARRRRIAFSFSPSRRPGGCRRRRRWRTTATTSSASGNLCRWLGSQAEALGVEIYPGFAAAEVLYDEEGRVRGVATGDMGIGKDGAKTDAYQPGIELHARQTVFAEGCRGSLTKTLFERFALRDGVDPQTYGIGIKELWEMEPNQAPAGAGDSHRRAGRSTPGPMAARSCTNSRETRSRSASSSASTTRTPTSRRTRSSSASRPIPRSAASSTAAGGSRTVRARSSEGGFQSIPKLTFPGGLLIGDSAGFLNVPKIKGTHTAMKSGMTAAEALFEALGDERAVEIKRYPERLKQTWVWDELYRVRNIRPAFRWGLWGGIAYSAVDTYVFQGKAPWTLRNHADHTALKPAAQFRAIQYPKPDGKLTFDRLSSVFISNTNHEENQPSHLQLKDPAVPITVNLALYDAPEQRYCPAGVYEIVRNEDGSNPRLQINAQNCVHCKTCDIKDPTQNINWVVPQGGGGPNYPNM